MFLVKDAEHGVTGRTEYDKLPSTEASLQALREQIAAEKPIDIPAEFRDLAMAEDGAIIHGTTKVSMAYTKHSLGQMISRIKPDDVVGMAGYCAACPPDLRAINFNFWHEENYGAEISNPPSNDVVLRMVLRDKQMLARAVVSRQYVPLDDLPIVATLNEILPKGGRARFVRGDVKSWYSVFWASKDTKVGEDDIITGVRVTNSETGTSGAYIVPMCYSVKYGSCIILNGQWSRRQGIRHVGEAERKIVKTYTTVTETIDTSMARLREAATDFPMGFDTQQELAVAVSKYLTLPIEAVIKAIEACEKDMPSRASLVASLAAQAHDVHISRAEEIELAAGRLIDVGWGTLARYKNAEDK